MYAKDGEGKLLSMYDNCRAFLASAAEGSAEPALLAVPYRRSGIVLQHYACILAESQVDCFSQ